MKIGKIVGCLGVGALCVVTGGLAAPAIGAAVGTSLFGLSGAAATSAGLAALGGGSLAAGGLGMAGGTALIQAVAGGVGLVGAGIATNAAELAKSEKENEELKRKVKNGNIDNATKQKIIAELNAKIENLKAELKKEKEKNQKNDEKIRTMEAQLNDILDTLEAFKAA